jgi:hypothetical protein
VGKLTRVAAAMGHRHTAPTESPSASTPAITILILIEPISLFCKL